MKTTFLATRGSFWSDYLLLKLHLNEGTNRKSKSLF